MGTSLITKSLGCMRISKTLRIDTSASQTYGVVPQCFHRSLNHFRERTGRVDAILSTERRWRVRVGTTKGGKVKSTSKYQKRQTLHPSIKSRRSKLKRWSTASSNSSPISSSQRREFQVRRFTRIRYRNTLWLVRRSATSKAYFLSPSENQA